MSQNNCALSGCGKPVVVPHIIVGLPKIQYCSRVCADTAFANYIQSGRQQSGTARQPKTAEAGATLPPAPSGQQQRSTSNSNMAEVIASEFGSAAIIRHTCDRVACGKPVTLGWKGRQGEYCSNNCLKLAEAGEAQSKSKSLGEKNMTDIEVQDTDTDDSTTNDAAPAKAPKAKQQAKQHGKAKPAPNKKQAKPAKANKAAKPTKAAAAAASNNGNGRETINHRRTIKLLNKKSPFRPDTLRQQVLDMITPGMTVAELQKKAVEETKTPSLQSRSVAILRVCEDLGLCKVIEPRA